MIYLQDVSYEIKRPRKSLKILSNINLKVSRNEKVGIIANPGSGKSTLAKLLSGIEEPSSGLIASNSSTSWPIGFAGFFHPDLTAYDNIKLIARLSGSDPDRMITYCQEIGGLKSEMNSLVKKFSPTSRAILAYCCSIAVKRDIFIADDVISVGGKEVRARCETLMNELLKHTGLIFLSKNILQLNKFCDKFYALINGELIPCNTPEVGLKAIELWDRKSAKLSNGGSCNDSK